MGENVASRLREVILPLCPVLRKLHLECCIQCWAPQYTEDTDLQEPAQHKAMEKIKRLEHLSCDERLREPGLFSPEKRGFRGRGESN